MAEKLNVCSLPFWIAEAINGFSHIKNKIENLPKIQISLKWVVAVDSLSMLVEKYPSHQFSGVEPFGMVFNP